MVIPLLANQDLTPMLLLPKFNMQKYVYEYSQKLHACKQWSGNRESRKAISKDVDVHSIPSITAD